MTVRGDPVVSVVVGVYNGARALPAVLDNVLGQQSVELECVVVDDGSTDATWTLLEERAATEPRLRPVRRPHEGLTRALIVGCGLARGEFIARQDVGDRSLPGRFYKQQALLAARPELVFAGCQCVTVGPKGESLGAAEPSDGGRSITASLLGAAATPMRGPHHGSVMFRRSAYERVGGYRPEFYFAQDLDLWSRLIEVGALGFVAEPLYESRFETGSITALHRARQQLLADLVREAAARRRRGESEAPVLQRASLIRPPLAEDSRRLEADAQYFVGSCLQDRGDPAAAGYLWRAVAANPLHLKAWARLITGRMRRTGR